LPEAFTLFKSVIATAALLVMPLWLWRITFVDSDLAALFLLLLATAIFMSVFSRLTTLYRAQLKIAFQPNSPHTKWFTGRLGAFVRAIATAAIATPILAWLALSVDPMIASILGLLCVTTSFYAIWLEHRFLAHLTKPFAQMFAIPISCAVLLAIFIPVLSWLNWTTISYSVDYLNANLGQAALIELDNLPHRSSWIAEILSVFYVIEASKLWLAIQLGSSVWAGILFSIDTALVAIIIAHVSANLTFYIRPMFLAPIAKQDPLPPKAGKTASRAFWGTIIALIVISIGLTGIALLRQTAREPAVAMDEQAVELHPTVLQALMASVAGEAYVQVLPDLDRLLDDVYAPVYAAIPGYTSFHYSIYGEYTELAGAVFGDVTAQMQARLFEGFEDRLSAAGRTLDFRYVVFFTEALNTGLSAESPDGYGPQTEALTSDRLSRLGLISSTTALVTKFGTISIATAAATALATKIAISIAAKVGLKLAAKGGSVLAGAGTGAAICSWSGPGAILCGVGGAAIMWFTVDAVIINIDEYFTRDDFEAELRQFIDEDRAALRAQLQLALQAKAIEAGAAEDHFTLRDLLLPVE